VAQRNRANLSNRGGRSSLDIAQDTLWSCADRRDMKPPDKPRVDDDEPPKPTRSEEALRIIEEYADQLRNIIKRLRRRQ
jgi:hypothetical protein